MKNRDEGAGGKKLADPFRSGRSTALIGRLGHHVETRNRKEPAGTSMAAYPCFAHPFAPSDIANRSLTVIFLRPYPLFFSAEREYAPLRCTVTHFPVRANSANACSSLTLHALRFAFVLRSVSGRYPAKFMATVLHRTPFCTPRGFQLSWLIRRGRESHGDGFDDSRRVHGTRIANLATARATIRATSMWVYADVELHTGCRGLSAVDSKTRSNDCCEECRRAVTTPYERLEIDATSRMINLIDATFSWYSTGRNQVESRIRTGRSCT